MRLLQAQASLNRELIAALCDQPALSFTRLRDYLEAYAAHPEPQDVARAIAEAAHRCIKSHLRTPGGIPEPGQFPHQPGTTSGPGSLT